MIDTKALRNKILDLAISGKLTEQLPEDGNAEDLYAQIQEVKAKLIADGKIKKEKHLPLIDDEEIPCEIPENWICCRLGSIITLQSGADLKPSDYNSESIGIPYMTGASNFGEDGSMLINRWTDKPKNIAKENDILLSCKGTVGKLAVLKIDEVHIARQIMAIRTYCKSRNYLFYYLLSVVETLKNAQKGLIPGIERSDILERVCSLPPLAEQKRIVSVVEDAFAVIDRIEKAQESYFADQEVLKNKIIDAGIRGKLTEQLPEDGNAGDLYVQIQEEKNKLIAEGTIKKEKTLPPITEEEIPFEIPENWKWVRLADISKVISKGTTPRGGKAAYIEKGIGFLRAENLGGYDRLNKNSLKYIDERTHNGFLKRSILEQDDILISIAGTLGRTAIVRKDDLPLNANQAIAFIRLILNDIASSRFISYILNASSVQIALGNKKVAMAIPNLSLEVISNIIIPIPPLPEQKRINSVIEKAFALINI